MTRILSVDDSRAIRVMITRQMHELGFEVDEAEDGAAGLNRLEECEYDLVILDVTMPVMDGPAMLAAMRANGNQTPVLMLTSESKKGVVAEVMKSGIDEYILKPFKPEELRAKVLRALKMSAAPGKDSVGSAPAVAEVPVTPGRQFIDILVVDDMENVQKRLRTLIPQHVTMNAATSARQALSMCRERVYRVVLIDSDIPDVDSATLTAQIRSLQPQTACLALSLRSANNVKADLEQRGFDGVLLKPFDAASIDDFLVQYFDNQEVVNTVDDIVTVAEFAGKEDRFDKYLRRVDQLGVKSIEQIAAACFETAIVDISKMPARADRLPRLIANLASRASEVGLRLSVVGNADIKRILGSLSETVEVPCFLDMAQARAAE